MANPDASRVHYIPAGACFADDLVAGIMTKVDDPACMASAMILLPNRRLTQAVRLAFLRYSAGKPQILPRLMAIGDIDTDDADLVVAGWDAGDLPPVIDPLERQFLLARLVHLFRHQNAEKDISQTEAFGLARALGEFLDQMQTNGVDFKDLSDLVTSELADHWQNILAFLKILTENWPDVLHERGKTDQGIWRDAAIRARDKAWQENPPQGLVIIAGSTGSVPATQALMKTVLTLPQGYLVLPGLDMGMEEEEWGELTTSKDQTVATHPQFQLARLLNAIAVDRKRVTPWPSPDLDPSDPTSRLRLLREVMRLSSQTQKWYGLRAHPLPDQAVSGMEMVTCRDRREEARVIALAMREVLETPDRTASLITADKALGQMVSMELSRWGIGVPSSAGMVLSQTKGAQFLRLMAEAWADDFSPQRLLALTQHPYCCGGMDRAQFRDHMRQIERQVIRQREDSYQGGGLERLQEKAAKISPGLEKFVKERLIDPYQPLLQLHDAEHNLARIANAHAEAAEALSHDGITPNLVWQGRDGHRLAGLFDGISRYGSAAEVDAPSYATLIEEFMASVTIYPEDDLHPRLSIMGLVEARMQASDLMILGGMNEGTTPQHPEADPWMSRKMRGSIGLPTPFWRAGMAAHDVMMTMAAPKVMLTRSRQDNGTPTEPSRWWRRLMAVLTASQLKPPREQRLVEWDRRRHHLKGRITPALRPQPVISLEERRRHMMTFSATQLEVLMRDPYAIYARRVLGLKALDPVLSVPDPALKGTLYHRAIHGFMSQYGSGDLPDDALRLLLTEGDKQLSALDRTPWIKLFWQLRFKRIAAWLITDESRDRPNRSASYSEARGKARLAIGGHDMTITAEADRIDLMQNGAMRIIDYKTGKVPTQTQVNNAINCQLIVEAMIAKAKGFEGISTIPDEITVAYWKLSGTGNIPAKKEPRPGKNITIDEIITLVEDQLVQVMKPETPFLSETVTHDNLKYSDYRHLARVKEWAITSEDEADDHEE